MRMQSTVALVALLLVAAQTISAEHSQQGEAQHSPVELHSVHHQQQQQQQQQAAHQGPSVVVSSEPAPVVPAIEHQVEQHVPGPHHQAFHQAPVYQFGGQQQQQPGLSYYSPAAGVIQVVQSGEKPQPAVPGPKHYAAAPVVADQYGQPESASIPANYKPFGSWGLYIGGNPADGYYTNYYKSLGTSVEKQQSEVGGAKPAGASFLRQASGSPYVGVDVYPYEHSYYTPADLNSGVARFVSPMQAGSQVYGTPSASYEPGSSLLSYADSYATKRLGSHSSNGPHVQQQQQQQVQQQQIQQQHIQQQSKGYQARSGYVYSPLVVQASGVGVQPQPQQQQQPQVVAYPVPVGSQIVGSQPGVEAAFQPYGVHAFTRYAVRPTVVGGGEQQQQHQQQQYYPAGQYGPYKPQVAAGAHHYGSQQPLSFYGYPLSQLHYSPASISPASSIVHSSPGSSPVVAGVGEPVVGHHSPAGLAPVEPVNQAASEKSESMQENKAQHQHPHPADKSHN